MLSKLEAFVSRAVDTLLPVLHTALTKREAGGDQHAELWMPTLECCPISGLPRTFRINVIERLARLKRDSLSLGLIEYPSEKRHPVNEVEGVAQIVLYMETLTGDGFLIPNIKLNELETLCLRKREGHE